MTSFKLAILCGAMLAPAISGAQAPQYTASRASIAPIAVDTLFAHAEYLDPIATVLGWKVLRQAPVADSGFEVRVWAEGGMNVTGNVLRLVEKGDSVSGELAVYWSLAPSESGAYGGTLDAQMKTRFGCAKVSSDTAMIGEVVQLLVGACVAKFKTEPDWSAVLKELESHQLRALDGVPDTSRVLKSEAEPGIVVELVQDGMYRTYHYPRVSNRSSADAAQAEALLDVVARLTKQADREKGPPGAPIR